MRTNGDNKYRRDTCYTNGAVENTAASLAMSACYKSLEHLITDDLTANVFQVTYCRITRVYHGGDFVRKFTRLFWSTMCEYTNNDRIYQATHYALSEKSGSQVHDPDED